MSLVISSAKIASIPGSVRKINSVISSIRGLKVEHAVDVLSVNKKRISPIIIKLINSAVANSSNKGDYKKSLMSIGVVDVGKSFSLKRYNFGGRGRTGVMNCSYSFVRIFLVI